MKKKRDRAASSRLMWIWWTAQPPRKVYVFNEAKHLHTDNFSLVAECYSVFENSENGKKSHCCISFKTDRSVFIFTKHPYMYDTLSNGQLLTPFYSFWYISCTCISCMCANTGGGKSWKPSYVFTYELSEGNQGKGHILIQMGKGIHIPQSQAIVKSWRKSYSCPPSGM